MLLPVDQLMNSPRPVILLVALILGSCSSELRGPYTRETAAMNTYLAVTVYDRSFTPEAANAAIDSGIREVRRIEREATDYDDSSEVGRLNRLAGADSVVLTRDLVEVLRRAIAFSKESGGAFDPTIGPVVKGWDFLSEHPRMPSPEAVAELVKRVNVHGIRIRDTLVYLERSGMAVDLGAIAKGYAVDRALEAIRRAGVTQCIVDLGGNLGVTWDGTHGFESTAATIFIRDPRADGEYFGSFPIGSAGISTSGDYQRFFIQDGIRYHHIIDPSNGYPARGVVAVTVVAENATDADAISTLVFVLGKDRGMKYLQNTSGVEGIIVYEQGDSLAYLATERFAAHFTRLKGVDEK